MAVTACPSAEIKCECVQLQKTGDWDARVDAAFAKLDSNGDGYIDLEELLAQLPFEAEESYDGERLIEVHGTITQAVALPWLW